MWLQFFQVMVLCKVLILESLVFRALSRIFHALGRKIEQS